MPQGANITSNCQLERAQARVRFLCLAGLCLGAGLLAGCAYHGGDTVDMHYQRYHARMPEGDRVFA